MSESLINKANAKYLAAIYLHITIHPTKIQAFLE